MATVIILVPGPSVLFVVGRALAHGRRTALTSVLGNETGALLLAAAVALGVGSLVAESAVLFTAIKLVGAVYLVYLGVQALRHRRKLTEALGQSGGTDGGGRRAFWQGLIVGVTNPKTSVFFAAVLPQFVDRGAGHVPMQMALFGVVFCLIALLFDSMWGVLAAGARSWFARSPRRLAMVGGTGGLMMIGLGVTIAATGRKD
ncbi:LysE family translocator [Actinomadura rupiterrae]|uniref:LysE family translocator n=1 Tax=Actinomadura rupiterrae TaxID=559627 RepID=UPI0020A465B4|nr:LysE family translocator [Actinomadura rupiterrae]MCP2341974.1 threonine/homoserine/homoserine lactone efflux protein [Actinomadura rupiterrae]